MNNTALPHATVEAGNLRAGDVVIHPENGDTIRVAYTLNLRRDAAGLPRVLVSGHIHERGVCPEADHFVVHPTCEIDHVGHAGPAAEVA